MISDVTNAIARAIYDAFSGEEAPTIYTEAVEQGLKEPCFFIACSSPSRKKGFDKIYCHSLPFIVQYVPSSNGDVNAECTAICERLFVALEYIELGDGLIRGINMHSEIRDGVLSFSVSYEFNTYSKNDIPFMECQRTETDVRG